ncbi:MAG: sodium:alanine symporter family protein, partial [Francisellaceae bacterium]|nr:sodium:alanine symporter family protein [Francisellaceae bacterium]
MNILALVGQIKDGLSYFLVIPLVFIVGLFFSISLNWLQLKHFKTAFNCILNHNTKSQSSGFSSFAALSAVLGGNLGTGNIAGVAVALSVGGPGALFWMWLMAILGSVIKFVGAYLGVIYRRETNIPGANFIGGPMYYLEDGLNLKFLAKVYAWCMIISAFLVGNLVQINSLSLPLEILPLNIPPLGFGVMVALLVGWIIFSKAKVFIRFVTMVVPFMAVVYLGACTYILLVNYSELPKAIYLIITSAFDVKSILSGGAAYTVAQAVKSGFDRGLFATDAGVGLAAILHSEVEIDRAKLKEGALLQGLVSIIAPIIVLFICTVTGLVLIVTGAWSDPCLQSTNLCIKAFNLGIKDGVGSILVTVTLILFAVTTILTWLHCARRAIDYLVGSSSKKWAVVMQVLFLLVIPLGTVANVQFSWIMADIFLNLLLVINLYGLFRLFSRHK